MSDDAKQGHAGAHTPDRAAEKQPVGDLVTKLEAFRDAGRAADLDLFALLEDSAERDQTDTLSMAAASVTEARRGRGRPLGSKNLRNAQVFDLLEAQGHRDPVYVVSLIQSIDPLKMAELLASHKHMGRALDLILKAASELIPYKLAKRTPDTFEAPEPVRPVMIINQVPVHVGGTGGGAMSVSSAPVMRHDVESIDNSDS